MSEPHPALLRPSRILKRLRAGELACCVKLNIADPTVVEVAGLSGVDCVWLDMEHVPTTLNHIQHAVRAAHAVGIDAIVRVPRGSYSDLNYPLEMDAAAIMVPHVMSADDARQVAQQTKFHPIGRRALDGGNADGGYTTVPLLDYLQHANHERLVIAQIEDPEALDELDAIAATPGIDVLMFGPGDFTQGIGRPGEFDHPEVAAARQAVAAAAKAHGKWAATVGALSAVPRLAEMGYQLISSGADVVGLRQYFSNVASTIGGHSAEAAAGVYQA